MLRRKVIGIFAAVILTIGVLLICICKNVGQATDETTASQEDNCVFLAPFLTNNSNEDTYVYAGVLLKRLEDSLEYMGMAGVEGDSDYEYSFDSLDEGETIEMYLYSEYEKAIFLKYSDDDYRMFLPFDRENYCVDMTEKEQQKYSELIVHNLVLD